jgi:hypothetical protein
VAPVHERTRAAALQAARRIYSPASEAVLPARRRTEPSSDPFRLVPQPEQIVPTELDLNVVYLPSTVNRDWIGRYGWHGLAGTVTW